MRSKANAGRGAENATRGALAIASAIALMALWPIGLEAQQSPKVHRVAYIATTSALSDITGPDPANASIRGFVHGMRDLGYVHGKNAVLDMRTLGGKFEHMETLARELIRLRTDVVVLATQLLAPAVRKVSGEIPLVMLVGADIESSGLIKSLAKPGGNMTGLSVDGGVDQEAKRLQLLHEIRQDTRRVAFLASEPLWKGSYGRTLADAAQRLGIALVHIPTTSESYMDAFKSVSRERVDGLLVSHGPVEYGHRTQIGQFAAKSGLPSSCAHGETVESGCLVSYGVDLPDVCRRLAGHVDKILKGANAGDLPIELPTKLQLVVNLKTAKALGISIPQSMLLRADRVIE